MYAKIELLPRLNVQLDFRRIMFIKVLTNGAPKYRVKKKCGKSSIVVTKSLTLTESNLTRLSTKSTSWKVCLKKDSGGFMFENCNILLIADMANQTLLP